MSSLPDALALLAEIAWEAGQIAVTERKALQMELKPDVSIVTNADRAAERYLKTALPRIDDRAGFWGEEYGHGGVTEGGLWLVDPVDGTSNFAFGGPLWGNSIALYANGDIALGAIALPDLNELYVAGKGLGAYLNGQPLDPIPPGPVLSHELVATAEDVFMNPNRTPLGKIRRTGAFVIDGTSVATQRFRALIGSGEGLYDAAASILICRELGAVAEYLDSAPLDYADLATGVHFPRPWIIRPADA